MKNKCFLLLIWMSLIIMPVFSYATILDVPLVEQEQDQWCWAGSTQSVLKYYGNEIKQCEIAEYTRTRATWHDFGSENCCSNPGGSCNYWNYIYGEPGSIENILDDLGKPTISNDVFEKVLTKQECADNFDKNRPFIIRVCCDGHFIVGRGLENDNLYYMDPWPGEGFGYGPYGTDVNGRTWTHTAVMTVSPNVGTSCGVPGNLSATNIGETTATLNWGAVSSAQSYDVQYKATSATSWTSASSFTNLKEISGLTAATNYEIQVRTVCSAGPSAYSASSTFTTAGGTQDCAVPSGLTASKVNGNSATLNWNGVPSATKYRIRYRKAN